MNEQALAKQLVLDEALRLKPYKDTEGILTIGVGRNLIDRGISEDEALYLLSNDIKAVVADLDRCLSWWRQMSDNRQLVLANMCFNLGINRLLGFTNTLKFMALGQYDKAADGMLNSKWAGQVGNRAKRLADMMRKG